MPKNEILWTEEDWQKFRGDGWNDEESWRRFRAQHIVPVAHEAEVTLCYVSGNEEGNRSYGIYIEDAKGKKLRIGFEMMVSADGSIDFIVAKNALEILSFLKPELVEQLEREEKEELQRERAAQQQNNE